jgi:hypothetical protein
MSVGGIALAVGVGSSLMSASAGRAASKAQRKAAKERRKVDLMKQFLQRRQMLQEYRMSQAQARAGAVASGAELESSGYQGVQSSLYSQADYNLRTEEAQMKGEAKAFKGDMQASGYQEKADLWGAAANIAFSFAGGIKPKAPRGGGGAAAPSSGGASMGGVSATPYNYGGPATTYAYDVAGGTGKATDLANINGGAFSGN